MMYSEVSIQVPEADLFPRLGAAETHLDLRSGTCYMSESIPDSFLSGFYEGVFARRIFTKY